VRSVPPARNPNVLLSDEDDDDDLPRQVPPVITELVLSCLARCPEDRPTAAEVAESVEPLIARLPKPVLGGFRPARRV